MRPHFNCYILYLNVVFLKMFNFFSRLFFYTEHKEEV